MPSCQQRNLSEKITVAGETLKHEDTPPSLSLYVQSEKRSDLENEKKKRSDISGYGTFHIHDHVNHSILMVKLFTVGHFFRFLQYGI